MILSGNSAFDPERRYSLLPGSGIRENLSLRRVVGEPQEAEKKEAHSTAGQNAKGRPKGFVRLGSAGQGKLVGNPKRDDDTQKKSSQVQEEHISTQKKSIGIIEKRDGKCPCQKPRPKGGGQAGIFVFQLENHEQPIEEHREEQQLHVLPYRLVHRSEKSHKSILPAPVIQKMRQRPHEHDENGTDDG